MQSPTVGQLIVGDEDNAAYLLHVTSPDGGMPINSGDLVKVRMFETGGGVLFDTPLATTNLRLNDNDSGTFTYITPRYAGLQAGVSYIPTFEQAGGDNNSALTRVGTGDNVRASGHQRRRRRRPQLHQHLRRLRRAGFGRCAAGGELLRRTPSPTAT